MFCMYVLYVCSVMYVCYVCMLGMYVRYVCYVCMLGMCYVNGFLDLQYPNFDTKHGFLSSIEAEMISFTKEGSHLHFRHFASIL